MTKTLYLYVVAVCLSVACSTSAQQAPPDVTKALELPQSREFFAANSFERVDLDPQQFAKLIHRTRSTGKR